jgi:type IV secretory pathway VirB9-like protein
MKVIEERLKRFIQADALVVEHVKLNQTPIQSEIEQQPTQNEQEVAIIYPEQVTNSTLMNEECEEEADYLNVKFTYNSPLDFLRSNKNKYANNKSQKKKSPTKIFYIS